MDRTDASQLKTKIKDTAFTGFEGNEARFEHLPLMRWPLSLVPVFHFHLRLRRVSINR